MTIPENCNLFNYPIYPQPASIETIHGGKKIVKYENSNESFLALDKDELGYEKLMLIQFKESTLFSQSAIVFRLWVDQRIQLIENFMSEYYKDA